MLERHFRVLHQNGNILAEISRFIRIVKVTA